MYLGNYVCTCLLSDVIVGMNKYKLDKEEPLEVRSIDNSQVLQIRLQASMSSISILSPSHDPHYVHVHVYTPVL